MPNYKALLTDEQRKRFEDAAYAAYNSIGPDSGWDEKTPSKAVFFDVIEDVLYRELSKADRDLWDVTSKADRRRIIFAVGP